MEYAKVYDRDEPLLKGMEVEWEAYDSTGMQQHVHGQHVTLMCGVGVIWSIYMYVRILSA